jgi:hypothetical protein
MRKTAGKTITSKPRNNQRRPAGRALGPGLGSCFLILPAEASLRGGRDCGGRRFKRHRIITTFDSNKGDVPFPGAFMLTAVRIALSATAVEKQMRRLGRAEWPEHATGRARRGLFI